MRDDRTNINNPAGRLLGLLEVAQATNAGRARDGWAKVFGIDSANTADLLQRVGELSQLIDDARRQIKALPDVNHEIHIRPLKAISGWFQKFALNEAWDQVKQRHAQGVINELRFTADALRVASREKTVPKDILAQLQAHLDELVNDLTAAEVDQELKAALLNNLELARQALLHYRLWGNDGLRRAVDANVGGILRVASKQQQGAISKYAQKAWHIMVEINNAISVGDTAYQLGPAAADVISRWTTGS